METKAMAAIPDCQTGQALEIREVPGVVGYGASADGRIWSRWKNNGPRGRELCGVWHQIGGKPDQNGRIPIRCHGRSLYAHRLVLMAWVGPCPPGMETCHNNGIPSDNRVRNLRWGTHVSNMTDKWLHGTKDIGEKSSRCKLTSGQVREIRSRRAAGERADALATEFNVHAMYVHVLCRNEKRQYDG